MNKQTKPEPKKPQQEGKKSPNVDPLTFYVKIESLLYTLSNLLQQDKP